MRRISEVVGREEEGKCGEENEKTIEIQRRTKEKTEKSVDEEWKIDLDSKKSKKNIEKTKIKNGAISTDENRK